MKIWIPIALCSVGCGDGAKTGTSCETVGEHLAVIDAGRMASFMTEKDRKSRAKRWIATCAPMTEPQRRCVLAAARMEDVTACSGVRSGRSDRAPTSSASWVLRGGDSEDQWTTFLGFTSDGDVLAAGSFSGELELHGAKIKSKRRDDAWLARLSPDGNVRWLNALGGENQDYIHAVASSTNGTILVDVASDKAPRVFRHEIAADGTLLAAKPLPLEDLVDDIAVHADGDAVVGSRSLQSKRGDSCGEASFRIHRITDGKVSWSRCNDNNVPVDLADAPVRVAASADNTTVACGGFLGSKLSWGGTAAPDGPAARTFVVSLDEKGVPRWARYLTDDHGVRCDALAVTADNAVVAMVDRTTGSELSVWDSDGEQRWTKSCGEVFDQKACKISAITTSDAEILVTARLATATTIATLDATTGAVKATRVFESGAVITRLATNGTTTVFAVDLSGSADFGTGPVESTPHSDRTTSDVLIGAVQSGGNPASKQ